MRRVVLVTRPEPGLSETMRAVAALGFEPMAAPMLRVEPLSPAIPRRVQAVLLTSGQAVEPLARVAPWLRQTPLLAVGKATAERARRAGFQQVGSADGDSVGLASVASRELTPAAGPLLLACGRGHAADLAATLRRSGFAVLRRCVYRTVPALRMPAGVLDALDRGRLFAASFFSPDTARIFAALLPGRHRGALSQVQAIVISDRTAAALSGLAWQGILVADEPNAAAVLGLLRHGVGS